MSRSRAGARRTAVCTIGGAGLGVVTGLLVVAVHGRWWSLALGAAATLAVAWALPAGAARLAFAAGAAGLGVSLARATSEGDLVIAADARGYLLEAVLAAVVVASVVTLPAPRRSPESGERAGGA